jgi:hypothetical protein
MFFSRDISPQELRLYCGSPEQLARISSGVHNDGSDRGMRFLDFRTGTGFNFTVNPDLGLDITHAEYRGRNLAYMPVAHSGTAGISPATDLTSGALGGLLTTLGPLSVGPESTWFGSIEPMTGRHHMTPANRASHDTIWAGDTLMLLASGEVRHFQPPHTNLVVRRRIQACAGERSIRIHDTLSNDGLKRAPNQMAYSIQAGFPLLSEISSFCCAHSSIVPRDVVSEDERGVMPICRKPTEPGEPREYFLNAVRFTDGRAGAAILAPDLDNGIGLFIRFDPEVLPLLRLVKTFSEGAYHVAFGPSNCYAVGLDRQSNLGGQRFLEPEETIDYHLEIGILEGSHEIMAFERECELGTAETVPVSPILK